MKNLRGRRCTFFYFGVHKRQRAEGYIIDMFEQPKTRDRRAGTRLLIKYRRKPGDESWIEKYTDEITLI